MKKRILMYLIGILLISLIGVLLFADQSVFAQSTPAFPDLFPGEGEGLGDFRIYVRNFYIFAIGASILLATVLIMIGGVIWVTSAGNQSRVEKAKEYIISPIIGVVILLSAYVILRAINPALVELKKPTLPPFAIGACLVAVEGKEGQYSCSQMSIQQCCSIFEETADKQFHYNSVGTTISCPPDGNFENVEIPKFEDLLTCNDACPAPYKDGSCDIASSGACIYLRTAYQWTCENISRGQCLEGKKGAAPRWTADTTCSFVFTGACWDNNGNCSIKSLEDCDARDTYFEGQTCEETQNLIEYGACDLPQYLVCHNNRTKQSCERSSGTFYKDSTCEAQSIDYGGDLPSYGTGGI